MPSYTLSGVYVKFGGAFGQASWLLQNHRLPAEWLNTGVTPAQGTLTSFTVLPNGHIEIDLAGTGDLLKADVRPHLKIRLAFTAGGTSYAAEARGIPDATDPYLWAPENAADWRELFLAMPSSGLTATLTIDEQRDLPFPWRAGLRFASPNASVKARPTPFRLGLGFREPLAPAKARPAAFRTGLRHGEPLARAKARPEAFRIGLGFREPRSDKIGSLEDFRIGLSFPEPDAIRYAIDNADALRVGLGFGEPLARAEARAEAFRIGLGWGSPDASRAVPDRWRAGIAFRTPAFKVKARPSGALRLGLAFAEPFAGSLRERLELSLRASAPRERILEFVELRHPSAIHPVRLVNDTADVTLGGEVWIATRFEARLAADEGRRAPTAELLVGNVGRAIDQWVSLVGGGAGGTMRYFEALAADGAAPEFEIEMDIADIQTDSLYVTISLGYDPLLGRPLVARRFDPAAAPGLF